MRVPPCPECSSENVHVKTEGASGMEAFQVTYVECRDCLFKVSWEMDPDGRALEKWRRMGDDFLHVWDHREGLR